MIVDVSSSLSFWLEEGYSNEGFIIKHESQKEDNDIDYGQLKFFSKETHTIYQPKIRIGWDDSRYETGSLQALPEEALKEILALTEAKKKLDLRENFID